MHKHIVLGVAFTVAIAAAGWSPVPAGDGETNCTTCHSDHGVCSQYNDEVHDDNLGVFIYNLWPSAHPYHTCKSCAVAHPSDACIETLAQLDELTAKHEDLVAAAAARPNVLAFTPGADHLVVLCRGSEIGVIPLEAAIASAP